MSAPFQSVMSCSLATAACQVTSYTAEAEGVYDDGGRRVGTRRTWRVEGEIWASGPANLATALAAFRDAAVDGADFAITAAGPSTLESVAAADCLEGPRVSFSYGESQGPTHQQIALTVEAVIAGDDDEGLVASGERVTTAVNVEGLSTITHEGELTAAPGADPGALALAALPDEPAGWQRTYSYTVDEDQHAAEWTATLTELVNDYPAAEPPGTERVVDGERTITTADDEHNRRVMSYGYSYTGDHAQAYIEAQRTALRAAGGLLRAEVAVTHHKTRSATGRFDVLTPRVAGVLELVEQVSHSRSGPLLREVRYPGTTPLIVVEAVPAYAYSQSGRAIGAAAYPQPPDPLFAAANYSEAPQVVFSRPNDAEFETSWSYRWLFADAQDNAFPHDRTGSGGFF